MLLREMIAMYSENVMEY